MICLSQILCEINFEDSSSAKSAILSHLDALNFWIFLMPKLNKSTIFKAPKIAKLAVFALLVFTKLISRKMSVIQKFFKFSQKLSLKWKVWCELSSVRNVPKCKKFSYLGALCTIFKDPFISSSDHEENRTRKLQLCLHCSSGKRNKKKGDANQCVATYFYVKW